MVILRSGHSDQTDPERLDWLAGSRCIFLNFCRKSWWNASCSREQNIRTKWITIMIIIIISGSIWGIVMGSRWSGGYKECSDISTSLIRLTDFFTNGRLNSQINDNDVLYQLINNQHGFYLWSCRLHIHVFPPISNGTDLNTPLQRWFAEFWPFREQPKWKR